MVYSYHTPMTVHTLGRTEGGDLGGCVPGSHHAGRTPGHTYQGQCLYVVMETESWLYLSRSVPLCCHGNRLLAILIKVSASMLSWKQSPCHTYQGQCLYVVTVTDSWLYYLMSFLYVVMVTNFWFYLLRSVPICCHSDNFLATNI